MLKGFKSARLPSLIFFGRFISDVAIFPVATIAAICTLHEYCDKGGPKFWKARRPEVPIL